MATSKFERAHVDLRIYIPIDDAEITLDELFQNAEIKTLFRGLANLKAATKPKKENKRVKQSK